MTQSPQNMQDLQLLPLVSMNITLFPPRTLVLTLRPVSLDQPTHLSHFQAPRYACRYMSCVRVQNTEASVE